MHKTGITRGAAAAHTAWAKRAATHPRVVAALAAGDLSESYGRTICQWTEQLPEKYRDESDEDPERGFADRGVRLETTFQGAGVLTGDLTPKCAAVVGAVLEALAAPGGAEDDRSLAGRG